MGGKNHHEVSSPTYRLAGRAIMVIALLLIVTATAARAATITVNTISDTSSPSTCTLRDAIKAANTQTATNDCPAGSGDDAINFGVSGTITLSSQLPAIQNILTIDGSGQAVTIDGNGSVELLVVNTGAVVSLEFLTLENGMVTGTGTANAEGGAILNNGTLSIENCTSLEQRSFRWS